MVHHDEWDYDSPNPSSGLNVKIDGKLMPRVIMHGNKNGYLFVLQGGERRCGPHFKIPEVKVPDLSGGKGLQANNGWPTQPEPEGAAGQLTPHCATHGRPMTQRAPAFPPLRTGADHPDLSVRVPVNDAYYLWGGGTSYGRRDRLASRSGYSPQTNMLYICSQTEFIAYSPVLGGNSNQLSIRSGPRTGRGRSGGGRLTAVNMGTNTIAWSKSYRAQPDRDCYSGSVVTAGDLVFEGRAAATRSLHRSSAETLGLQREDRRGACRADAEPGQVAGTVGGAE